MNRRNFIVGLSGTVAAPPIGHAQQPQRMPVIGWLGSTSEKGFADRVAIFRASLTEAGYVEGQNIEIEYRWADDDYDRLPALATDLVKRHVKIIITGGGTPTVLAAKAATTSIPIIFAISADPIRSGVVVNLNRPEGNATGFASFTDQLVTKRMELLADLLPSKAIIGALLNPSNSNFQFRSKDMQDAARSIGREFRIVTARGQEELDKAITLGVELGIGGLVVQNDALFIAHRDQIVSLMALRKMPAIYEHREDVLAGGLLAMGLRLPNLTRCSQITQSEFSRAKNS